MNRTQLEHIIRASAGNADTTDIVVIGSQALLGTFADAPDELLTSKEAVVFPRDRPADPILIDGAIGERLSFHEKLGHYSHGKSSPGGKKTSNTSPPSSVTASPHLNSSEPAFCKPRQNRLLHSLGSSDHPARKESDTARLACAAGWRAKRASRFL